MNAGFYERLSKLADEINDYLERRYRAGENVLDDFLRPDMSKGELHLMAAADFPEMVGADPMFSGEFEYNHPTKGLGLGWIYHLQVPEHLTIGAAVEVAVHVVKFSHICSGMEGYFYPAWVEINGEPFTQITVFGFYQPADEEEV